jgi:hypothetical protein
MTSRYARTSSLVCSSLIGLSIALCNQPAVSADSPVSVTAYATHQDTDVVYHYEIVNRADSGIMGLVQLNIGERAMSTQSETTFFYSPAPQTPEEIGGFLLDIRSDVIQMVAPAGWYIDTYGDTGEWLAEDPIAIAIGPRPTIAPGQSGSVTVRLSKRVDSMIDTYFSLRAEVPRGHGSGYYGGRVERRDVTPPTLTAKMSPSSVSKLSGASLKVQAILTVTDDYDPQPEIKLESITASVPLNQSEIKDAKFGADDRLFILPNKKDPTGNPVVYTITYSAMDGTGNKATSSATVTLNP